MTIEPRPGDLTDVKQMLIKCRQTAMLTSENNPCNKWKKDTYLLVKAKNGTVIFRFDGYDIKEIDVSTKSVEEVCKDISKQ